METPLEQIPDEGELVLCTVREITPHGVYVALDEYGGMRGFLHISEISTGWVRHIERFAKPGQKMVLKVIRISRQRREVDLSLRQVSGEEKKQKLIEVKKAEKAQLIIDSVRAQLSLTPDDVDRYRTKLADEYGSVYDGLEEVAKKGCPVLLDLQVPEAHALAIEETVREKIVIPKVEVRGVVELSTALPNGIDVIREALTLAEQVKTGGAHVAVTYLGAPRYRIAVEAENYRIAERALESAVQKAQTVLEKKHGTFRFTREEGKRRPHE